MFERKSKLGRAICALGPACAISLASAAPASAAPSHEFLDTSPAAETGARLGVGESIGVSPFLDYQEIETDHFRVTYPRELSDAANRVATYLEQAHTLLTPKLGWEPVHKTQILVIDNADAANGMASPVQRFGIVLQVTPPDNWFSIGYYDDWLRILCFHEYTHIVNMDTTDGWFYNGLRVVFGDVFLPNTTLPPWMLEGLAVYMETRLTGAGRGKSPYYEMVLRSAVQSGVLDDSRFITLDKVNGTNPYYPGGETAYLFGYHLTNEVARTAPQKESALGDLSFASAGRFPYLINGNLENVTGKDWYQTWDHWTADTRTRIGTDLARLRSQPLTPAQPLTTRSYSVLGNASSPDGKWLAYTQESLDLKQSLFVRDIGTGKTRRFGEKSLGVGMAFTPDSKFVVYSSLQRTGIYNLYSDLGYADVASGRMHWLSDHLRARDPDVSPDGKQVVFTLTDRGTTSLAIAPLERQGDELKLGAVKPVFTPEKFGRVSNPKFLPGGKRAVFSLHVNGQTQEDLMEVDLASGAVRALVRDGHFNRFPAVDGEGKLHFVSDRTGVDNLFRREGDRSVQVTNTLTGIWLPSFGPSGLYASHYSNDGWDLARLTLSKTGYDSTALTIQGAPAPHPAPGEVVEKAFETHSSRDYSAFPSIWPRQWAPLLYGTSDGRLAFGGEVFGFDAVDRHRYLLGVLYDPQIRRPNWVLYYSNRQLGPSINLFTSGNQYLPVDSPGFLKEELKATVSADFPIRFTYSTLTPSARFNTERNAYVRDNGQGDVFSSSLEPSFDARLHYADAESSRLAITAEEGRSTELSARRYLRPGSEGYKAVLSESEYFRITDHSILNPRLRGSVSDRRFRGVNSSNVQVRGLSTGVFAGTPDLLDELPLRGYPGVTFQTRAAFTGSMDFRFPLWRIFRGWGTNPLFLENLSGFVFGESAYFPNAILGEHFVPSAGAGARLDLTALILVPVSATVEYQKGFREQFDGTGEVVFKLGLTGLPF